MVTGVETVSLVLAILPLLVKKLDDYATGLATLKAFRSKAHCFEMRMYGARLGAQRTILTNAILLLLEETDNRGIDITRAMHDPSHPLWQDPAIELKLRRTLSEDYEIFLENIRISLEMLQQLSEKLGLKRTDLQVQSHLTQAFRRFLDVFSRPIYEKLLANIEAVNSALRILTDDATRAATTLSKRRIDQRPLESALRTRKYARTLHRILTQHYYWKCTSDHRHVVSLRIDPAGALPGTRHDRQTVFNVSVSSHQDIDNWAEQELEVQPVDIRPLLPTVAAAQTSNPSGETFQMATSSESAASVIVKAPSNNTQSTANSNVSSSPSHPQLHDCCSTLAASDLGCNNGQCLGFLQDGLNPDHRHEIYFIRQLPHDMSSESLDISLSLAVTSRAVWCADQHYLASRGNRLRVATTLAVSLLHLQGNWLKPEWRSSDIVLSKKDIAPRGNGSSVRLGFSWTVSRPPNPQTHDAQHENNPLIRSPVLFPLGVVLIELALCQSLASLWRDEDADAVEDVAKLKTATRMLTFVTSEFGIKYVNVVKQCLFWQGPEHTEMDNEHIRKSVYETVVYPLIQCLRDFEGS